MTSPRGQAISLSEHRCDFAGCEGTIWRCSHWRSATVEITGRRHDVLTGMRAMVSVSFDETEDARPLMLVNVRSADESVDLDVSPTAAQARRWAIELLTAADALERWATR